MKSGKALQIRTQDVCDICGSHMESGDAKKAKFQHQQGKIHVGYLGGPHTQYNQIASDSESQPISKSQTHF